MNSVVLPAQDQVLKDLGDPFIRKVIAAVDGARADYRDFREFRPSWFVTFTNRFTSNFLHERIWAHLATTVIEADQIQMTDREPTRELRSGTSYLIRIKRHHPGDRISTYPTRSALRFWSNDLVLTLPGIDGNPLTLALGYYWDADERQVGDAVLSLRDGKDNPVWAVRLLGQPGTAVGFTWAPVEPDLPELDLAAVADADEEESGS